MVEEGSLVVPEQHPDAPFADLQAMRSSVGVIADAAYGRSAQPCEQPVQRVGRTRVRARAASRPAADEHDGSLLLLGRDREEGALGREIERGVEDDRAQVLREARRIRLHVHARVGPAVVVELLQAEVGPHGVDVLRHLGRAVEVRGRAELLPAFAHGVDRVGVLGLQRLALDRTGFARAALVDEHEIAALEQLQEEEVAVRVLLVRDRRVARPALGHEDRAERRLRRVRVLEQHVLDVDLRPVWLRAIERHGHAAAESLPGEVARRGRRRRRVHWHGQRQGCKSGE